MKFARGEKKSCHSLSANPDSSCEFAQRENFLDNATLSLSLSIYLSISVCILYVFVHAAFVRAAPFPW